MGKTRSHRVVEKLIGFAAVTVIVAAVVVQVGRWLAPMVADNRVRIENYLTEQLGARVQIGAIEARWESLRPELSVDRISVINADGDQVLAVEHASAQLGLLLSLRDLDLRLWHVDLNGMEIMLEQTAAGGWRLPGVTTAKSSSSFFDPVDALLISRHIQFSDVQGRFNFLGGAQQQIGFTEMRLDNDHFFHRLKGDLDLPGRPDTVQLVYEGFGDPRERDEFIGNGYLKLDNYPLTSAVAFVSESAAAHAGIEDGQVSAEIWLNTRPDHPSVLQGSVNFHRTTEINSAIPLRVSGQIFGHLNSAWQWDLNFQAFQAFWRDRQSQPLSVGLVSRDAENWLIRVPQLDLAEISRELDSISRMQESPVSEKVRSLVNDLGATGSVRNIHVTVPKAAPMDFVLRANLQQVSVNDWKGAPEIRFLDGYLETSSRSGFVEIDSPNRLLMHFPQIYHRAFEFDRAQGIVGWTVRPEQNQALVYSNRLSMQGSLGDASGYFYLDAPLERNSRPLELMLQIGLRDGHALDHKKLVPKVVPDSLLDWLDSAIVGGGVSSGGFLMEGYFGAGAGSTRSVQVALNVDKGDLKFDYRWPSLKSVSGFLEIDDTLVQGWVDEGQFLATALEPTYLEVGNNPAGEGSLLQINGSVLGDASSGLELLTQTPIHDVLGTGLDDWQLSGAMDAQVQLHIPLKAGESGSRQQVNVALDNASLSMTGLGLEFDRVNGELEYTDQRGLNATSVSARLWEQPLALNIGSVRSTQTQAMTTRVQFEGPLDAARLAAWAKRPEALFVEGNVPVKGTVTIAPGEIPVRVQASSNLLGGLIDLPPPYGKAASEKRLLRVDIPVTGSHTNYRFQYDDLVAVNLQATKNQPVQGLIALGVPSELHINDGLWLDGRIESLDAELWWPVLQRYQVFSEQLDANQKEIQAEDVSSGLVSQATAAANLNLKLLVDEFHWGDIQLNDVQVGGGQRKQGWRIRFDDERVKGAFFMADDGSPLDIDLDYINWPALSPDPEAAKASAAVSGKEGLSQRLDAIQPQDIPALDFSVGDLTFGEKHYGGWSFQLRPNSKGLEISNLLGSFDGIRVTASDADETANEGGQSVKGASLIWRKSSSSKQSTRFYGKLASDNLADIADAWQLPRMMDSESVDLDVHFRWPGNPADFSLTDLHGKMKIDVQDGRFYRSTGQASNALLRLLGLFNFDSWIRRLQLDFSDVFKGGTPFESVAGEIQFDQNMVYLTDPIEVKNTSSVLKMGGKINLEDETLDTSLVATLPVGGNATVIAAFAGGLPAAAGVYAISKIFKKQMERVASVSYRIKGSWSDPDIQFDKLFDNKAAQEAADDSRDAARDGRRQERKASK